MSMVRYLFIFLVLLIPSIACAAPSTQVGEIGARAVEKVAITLYIPKTIAIREQGPSNELLLSSNFNGNFSLNALNQGSKRTLIENYDLESRVVATINDLSVNDKETLIISPN